MTLSAASSGASAWAPIVTLKRGSASEEKISGIVYVWVEDRALYANAGRALLRLGDTRTPLAGGSALNPLLIPFLMMTWMPVLQANYPALTDAQFAMLMNNQAPPTVEQPTEQQRLLDEIVALAQLSKFDTAISGLRLAHQLYRHHAPADYPVDALLHELLSYLLNREDLLPVDAPECNGPMREFALSPVELAQLYHALVLPVSRDMIRQCPDDLTEPLACWERVGRIMREHAGLIGDSSRLDAGLVQNGQAAQPSIPLLALGASVDTLCVGIGPNARFADGLGIYVQLASAPDQSEGLLPAVMAELFSQLGLAQLGPDAPRPAGDLQFHFTIQPNP